jgi:hypothetical protein
VTDDAAFEANREPLFAVAYRMLGTVADARAPFRRITAIHLIASPDKLRGLTTGRTLAPVTWQGSP